MKLFLTWILCIALTSWLFAQDKTSVPVYISSNYGNENILVDSVAGQQSSTAYKADYELLFQLGYGPGGRDDLSGVLIAEVINGFLLSPEFYIGIGTGIHVMTLPMGFWTSSLGSAVVPIFGDIRIFLSKEKASPYISIDGGYSLDVNFGVEGLGFMIRPMAGISLLRNTKHPVHLGVGFHLQKIKNYNNLSTVLFCVGVGM